MVRAALMLAACGCGEATGPRNSTGIRFVSGAGAADTVNASLRLVVEVHDSTGAPVRAGTPVGFSTGGIAGTAQVSVSDTTGHSFTTSYSTTADQSGRAAATIRLGTTAGTAWVQVWVSGYPHEDLVDSASFTVKPGAAATIAFLPSDTTIYAGSSYTLRGTVTDVFGNPRSGAVTMTVHASASGISVSSAGHVSALQTGRYQMTASAVSGTMARTGTVSVSVVPHARMLTVQNDSLFLMDVDGSHARPVASLAAFVRFSGGIPVHPRWTPDGAAITYTQSYGNEFGINTSGIFVIDTLGKWRELFGNEKGNVVLGGEAMASSDGWVYYSARDTTCAANAYCLYRARIEGSAPELLLPASAASNTYSGAHPAPSPDGTRLAFSPFGAPIAIMDIATRTVTATQGTGDFAVWSPDASRIAYLSNDTLYIMNADGTNPRALSQAGWHSQSPIAWTADGNFLLAEVKGAYELVDLRDESRIPLPNIKGTDATLR